LLLSYFSRPPHPPTPPLFPYTTLFRSRAPVRQAEAGEDLVEDEDDVAFPGELAETFEVVSFRHDHARAAQDRLHDQGSDLVFVLDRKSTRLNSSHVSISYAVFCLKKKN